ncbi:MAG: hypothetical protein M3O82_06570, partial [Verrucomicrobiota bacterium]|nr:hypothetical protein [Verrucomicrobiota bacterium]
MAKVPARIKAMLASWRWRVIALAVFAALAVGFAAWPRRAPEPLALSTPAFVLDQIGVQTLFYNPAAAPSVPVRLKNTQRLAEFAPASRAPKLWRELDRQWRFDAVFLAGDPSQYRQLLQHLRTSRDWILSNLDHAGFLFRR